VIEAARASGRSIATAESCTGGLVAAALTDIAGSSAVFLGGLVTYANDAKLAWLAVEEATLAKHGAVSEAVVRQMARGARLAAGSHVAVAISGIAGPGGGTDAKPVGTVHLAWSTAEREESAHHVFPGDRAAVRAAATRAALHGLLELVK
jgi:nicotinamide-nucleotide amidase